MITNLLVIVFLIAMAYWWGLQGFFSAFIHLIITIIAAAIAFALWEPLVIGFLFGRMPEYAWGVGLLGPFILAMLLLRLPMDYLIKANVNFSQLINLICGGFCGVLSGIMSAGMVVIGLSFLPMGIDLAGYQPLGVEPSGRVTQEWAGLWVPVDVQVAGFMSKLSGGAFNAGHEMALYKPELARQASQFRLARHYDPNASLIATPPSVNVTQAAIVKTPPPDVDPASIEALGGPAKAPSNRIVAIETQWRATPGVYDQGTLYLAPVQIALETVQTRAGQTIVKLHQPIAFSRKLPTGRTELTPIKTDRISAKSSDQQQTIVWSFVVASDEEPTFLFARQLRLPLPKQILSEPSQFAALIGTPVEEAKPEGQPDQQAGAAPGEFGAREGIRAGSMPVEIEATPRLPDMISTNFAQGVQVQEGGVLSGRKDVPKPTGSVSQATRVDKVWAPGHQRVVRVKIARDQATSLYGASRAAAASLQQPSIEDNQGQRWYSVGYVWKKGDGSQQIAIDRDQPIRSARELPIAQMADGENLYLYFVVNPNTRIIKYHVGESTSFDCDPPVAVE